MNGRGLGALAAMAAVGAAVAGGIIYAHRAQQPAETPPPVELPAPEPEPAPEPVPAPEPPPPERAPEIIATLVELCRYLKSGPVTDKQVARRFGTITADQGPSSGFVIQPQSPLFRRGFIGHPWDDEEDKKDTMPSDVSFDLADPTQLTVAQLVDAFGPYYLAVRFHPEAPQGISFRWDSQSPGPIDCTVIAHTRGSPEGREDRAPVLKVGIRPDRPFRSTQ